jgi:hypothetical protein
MSWILLAAPASTVPIILLTDESWFTRDGIIKLHEQTWMARWNQHQRFSTGVWVSIPGVQHTGIFFCFPAHADISNLSQVSPSVIPQLPDDFSLQRTMCTWFIQNSVPPHFNIILTTYLPDNTLYDKQVNMDKLHDPQSHVTSTRHVFIPAYGHVKSTA